jgi:K+-transporting ATPase ATPase C chain
MLQDLRPAVVSVLLFTLILGLGYPLAMTGVAGVLFPSQAGGSLVKDARGQIVGSVLIAQGFIRPEYLHPRPSAAGAGYDPMSSGGSNLGPLDKKLIDRVRTEAAAITALNGDRQIPADAVTTSASGLDPDVSPGNAKLQVARIAGRRGVSSAMVQALIDSHTAQPLLGFIGQPSVNVLMVNRALDARFPMSHLAAP